MPERPFDPRDANLQFLDIQRRLRELERQATQLPEGAVPLQTFESGQPLGDTRYLDFGAGLVASLVGDDRVQVIGSGEGGWDAIIHPGDSIGQTLAGLKSAGKEVVRVLVRATQSGADTFWTTYTETANFNCPRVVYMQGEGDPAGNTGLESAVLLAPRWDMGGFINSAGSTLSQSSFFLRNMAIVRGRFAGGVTCSNCYVDLRSSSSITFAGLSVYLHDCFIHGMASLASSLSTDVSVIINGGMFAPPSGSSSVTSTPVADHDFGFFGVYNTEFTPSFGGGGTQIWNLPANSHIELANVSHCPLTLQHTSGSLGNCAIIIPTASSNITVNFTGTTVGTGVLYMFGQTNIVTLPQLGDMTLDITVRTADITGPGKISLDIEASNPNSVIIRGRGIKGSIGGNPFISTGATFLQFIAARECQVGVAASTANFFGTQRPYSFDATSQDNLLIWHRHTAGWSLAGTDAGTNNMVLPSTGGGGAVTGLATTVATEQTFGQASAVGTGTLSARNDHTHGTPPMSALDWGESGDIASIEPDDAASAGVLDEVARADHQHAVTAAAAGNSDFGDAATEGVSTSFARADHVHGREANPVGTPTTGWGSITNVVTNRVYDADATTLDELADVLGTLVADLVAQGILDA